MEAIVQQVARQEKNLRQLQATNTALGAQLTVLKAEVTALKWEVAFLKTAQQQSLQPPPISVSVAPTPSEAHEVEQRRSSSRGSCSG